MFAWTEDRVKHLVRFVRAMLERGFSAKHAWEAYAKIYNTTYASAMTLYYRGRKEYGDLPPLEWDEMPEEIRNAEVPQPTRRGRQPSMHVAAPADQATLPKVGEKARVPAATLAVDEDYDVLDLLSRLGKTFRAVGPDVLHALIGLTGLAEKASDCVRAKQVLEENRVLRERVAMLEQTVEALTQQRNELDYKLREIDRIYREKLRELESRLDQQRQAYEALNYIIEEFASLRTIDQVTALKDLRGKLKVETDRFGNVLRVTDEWKKEFERQLEESLKRIMGGNSKTSAPADTAVSA